MTDYHAYEVPAKDVSQLPVMHPGRPIGRDDLLKDIFNHLQSRRAVLLYGDAGSGKTALAAALSAAFVQQPGGVLWLSSGTHPFSELLVRVGRGLDLEDVTQSEQPAARVGVVATGITDKKPFIVLDNVVDALAPKQFIDKCADNTPMLLLSETELEGPWESVHVDQLADLDAVVMFKQKAGIKDSDSTHDIDIYGITKLMQYQPLAIVLGARAMVAAKQIPADYLKNLKQVSEASGNVTDATIALSYRALNNALQGLLLMLGATFTGKGSVDFIATVSGVPEQSITQAMTILTQLYLVEKFERYSKPYYRLHPKVYAFAQAALTGRNQLDSLQKKVHDATLDYARIYSDDATLDYEMLAKEMDNFIAAALWSADKGNRDTANQLVGALTRADDFVQDAGYVYELLQLRNTASGSTTAFPAYTTDELDAIVEDEDDFYSYDDDSMDDDEEDGVFQAFEDEEYDDVIDEDEEVYEDVSLDDLSVEEGMSSEALTTDSLQSIDIEQLRQALAQARQQGNFAQQVQILKAIGKVQVGQGKETEAITTYNEILNTYEAQNDDEGILDSLNMLSALLNKTGNTQASVMHATRGIQLAEQLGDDVIGLQLQTYLGDARQDLGETESAIESFKKALEIARKTDDKQYEAISLYKLGYAYLDNGDTDDAIHTLTQARELFKGQDKREYEGRVLGGLASAYSELERWGEAIGYYQSALHIAREVGNKEDEQVTLSNLGQAQVEARKFPDALLSYRQALHLSYQLGNRDDIVSSTVDLVRLMLMSNRLLGISQLLLDEAKFLDPDDRDVMALQDEIDDERATADAAGVQQAPVGGTAREYAANAYAVLDE